MALPASTNSPCKAWSLFLADKETSFASTIPFAREALSFRSSLRITGETLCE